MPEARDVQQTIRPLFKRPESVLVVVYTVALEVLLICRKEPAGFWQSVTGSLEYAESPVAAAQRELFEETGLRDEVIDHRTQRVFPIKGAWRKRYAPGVVENTEHQFSVQLPARQSIRLNPAEHTHYQWLPMADALARVSSHSNRAALKAILEAEGD